MSQPRENPLMAVLWMLGAVSSMSAMAVAARAVTARHEVFEILGWRSLVGVLLVLAVAASLGRLNRITAKRVPGHFMRNLVHFSGQSLWFKAVTLIPLSQVFALEFTSPIWVILLSPLLLGEKLTMRKMLLALIGFTGVLIVAQPDFNQPDPGVLMAASCAFFFGLTIIFTKRLTRHEDVISILFWLTLMQCIFGFGVALRDGAMIWPDAQTAPWLILLGVCGVTGHLCTTMALGMAPATFVSTVEFIRLPLIAIVGAAFYDEPMTFAVIIGAGLILGANWMNLKGQKAALNDTSTAQK